VKEKGIATFAFYLSKKAKELDSVFKKQYLKKMQDMQGASKKPIIMIVDDELRQLDALSSLFAKEYSVITADSGEKALELINGMKNPEEISLIISDQRMRGLTGIEMFEKLKDIIPNTIRILLTAYDEKKDIVDSINEAKIYEFILKPFESEELMLRVGRAVEAFERQRELDRYRQNLEKENVSLKESLLSDGLKMPEYFNDIITANPEMNSLFKYIEAIAGFNSPVLITGETGTEKELIAQVIHRIYNATNNLGGDFVADNVAGWNKELFLDTLCGHEKGSFTNALHKRQGLLGIAKDGTLYLEEIGDLPLELQTMLLRLTQEKKYFPIGSDTPLISNARFIFATNKDLNALKDTGEFRKDLFYRLNTHHIHIPPLRERKEDIGPLVTYFIEKASEEYNKEMPSVPDKLIPLLSNYRFEGNIRELRSMVFEAVSLHQSGELSLDIFIKKIQEQGGDIDFSAPKANEGTNNEEKYCIFSTTFPTFEEMVKFYTNEAMKRANDNQTAASKLAGLPRTTFIRYWKGQF
jgi:DNA-binding NtrC family response regulator